MKDIAKVAGVSVMSVSRALRSQYGNSPATRDRIVRIAEKMGYRPNPMVSALMSGRASRSKRQTTTNLAMLQLGVSRDLKGFEDGVVERSRMLGYSLDTFAHEPHQITDHRLRSILIHRGIRGIIVMPAFLAPYKLDFNFSGFAAAAIGFSVPHPRLPRVISDAYHRVLDASRTLYQRGYRRLGLVYCDDENRRFDYSLTAGLKVSSLAVASDLKSHALSVPVSHDGVTLSRKIQQKMADWIRQHEIEVIISQMDDVYPSLLHLGFSIPKDIGYLHLHRSNDPAIACMDQLCYQTGAKAVDVVSAMMHRNEYELPQFPSIISTPSCWIDGASVYPQKIPGAG